MDEQPLINPASASDAPPPAAQPIQQQASDTSTQQIQQAPPAQPTPTAAAAATPAPPRHGMAGILDAVADFLAGRNKPDQVSFDDNGNRVATPGARLSRGQQIAKIGMTALQGATTAAAAPPGPGHMAQGTAAAVQQQFAQQQQQQDRQEKQAEGDYQRAQQAKLEKINYQILSRKLISDQLTDTLRQQQGTREQIAFGNQMEDHERALGSEYLGTVQDAGHIADIGNKDPDAIKDYHDGRVVLTPIYDSDGKAAGMKVFKRQPDINALPYEGQLYKTSLVNGKPTLTAYDPAKDQHLTNGMATAINLREMNTYNEMLKGQDTTAQIGQRNSEVRKNNAEANKANAEAELANRTGSTQTDSINLTGAFAPGTPNYRNAEMLADADSTLDELPKRNTKGGPTVQDYIAAADTISKQKYSVGFQPAIVAQEKTFANDKKTQAFFDSVDRLVGTPTQQGLIDKVVDYAKKAGLNSNAPVNSIEQAVERKFGDKAAKDFQTALGEARRSVSGVIGNPLLGSGETDARLKQASETWGGDATVANLASTGDVLKGMLTDSRNSNMTHNRFLRKRYGAAGGQMVQPQQQQQPNNPAQNTAQAARAPWKPGDPVVLQPGEQTAKKDGKTLVVRGNQWVALTQQ